MNPNENVNFEFYDKNDPSLIRISFPDNPAFNMNARIRDVDDDSILVSPLVIPTCDGHFVYRLRFTDEIKANFIDAMRIAKLSGKEVTDAYKHELESMTNYTDCQFNLQCSKCDQNKLNTCGDADVEDLMSVGIVGV